MSDGGEDAELIKMRKFELEGDSAYATEYQ